MNDVDQHVAEVLQLLGMCAKLAPTFEISEPLESARRVLGEMRSVIEDLWTWLAENAATKFQGASVDGAHPGYVIRDQVLVPFYLLQDLPGTTELAELAALGLSLRVSEDGVICLSGSAALLGAMKFVGDIDYCEYTVPGTYSTTGIVASASAHAVRTECPLCERVKVVNPKWSRSCDAWDPTTPVELTRLIDEGAYQLKLDFITSTSAAGTVEATNMALLLIARTNSHASGVGRRCDRAPAGSPSSADSGDRSSIPAPRYTQQGDGSRFGARENARGPAPLAGEHYSGAGKGPGDSGRNATRDAGCRRRVGRRSKPGPERLHPGRPTSDFG